MTNVRAAAVAGSFYPANPGTLQRDVSQYLAATRTTLEIVPKAIIVPHAGYVYSGPIAASAYALLERASTSITRVILLGPSHRVALRGIAASTDDFFETPLGRVPLQRRAIAQLIDLKWVEYRDDAHTFEHSLEVQLPFLQKVLGSFELVPLVVGDASPDQVGQVLDRLWGGPETLIVISSDLSHYLPYSEAQRSDTSTSNAIETLRFEDLDYEMACGRSPICGLLWVARKRGLSGHTVDLRNSGDTAGDRRRVVGYGAYVFH